MKKFLSKALFYLWGLVGLTGILLILGAAGACDNGATVSEAAPYAVAGLCLFVGSALPVILKK